MPRTEKPLDALAGPVEAFANDLRTLREEAGMPPYRALAKRAGYSASTLSIAASGSALPSLDVTLAYVQACGGDPRPWRDRWQVLTTQQGRCDSASRADDRDRHETTPSAELDHRMQQSASVAVIVAAEVTPAAAAPRRHRLGTRYLPASLLVRAVLLLTMGIAIGAIGSRFALHLTQSSDNAASWLQSRALYADISLGTSMPLNFGTSADLGVDRGQPANHSQLFIAIDVRGEQIEELSHLDVSQIPDGPAIKDDLEYFWDSRATVDSMYLTFADGQESNVPAPGIDRTALTDFESEEQQAGSEAASLWNRHAQAMGEPQINERTL